MSYQIINCASAPYIFTSKKYGFFHDLSEENVYMLEFEINTKSQSPHRLIISDTIKSCIEYITENDLNYNLIFVPSSNNK